MICKKCLKNKSADCQKDISEKQCFVCNKIFRSRFINICPACQSKGYCTNCGKKLNIT